MKKNLTKATELYEVPVCELISESEVSVLCQSTTEPIDDGGSWDGIQNWN